MYIGPLTSAMNINFSVMVTGNLFLVSIVFLACIMEQGESGVKKKSFVLIGACAIIIGHD